jgi:aspartate carbamoyltransferase catalytic subunit
MAKLGRDIVWPNIIEAQQFSREWIEKSFFPIALAMEEVVLRGGCDILKGKVMVALFYEPSTRTRFSFEMAMVRMGGNVLQTENAREFSSAVKGETLEDSIRNLSQYRPDVIILRHHEEGSSARAASVTSIPVINAGDGREQHPTQALLDILTIKKELGRIDGINIAMVGDLVNGRTVRSLSYLLGKFKNVSIHFVSPECARMKPDIKAYLEKHGVWFSELNDLREVASEVNVIYQTRTQKERGSSFDRNDNSIGFFIVNGEILNKMKPDAIIMHPLPRNDEILTDVDGDHRAAYFRQSGNGLFTRMALLKMILAPGKPIPIF